jgi:NAD(P)-dependent dehydrogenase (short-subunit alcohol dehydrogenase family)
MSTWTTRNIPPQSGKRALVTGATGGLGLETALALAQAGAEVVLLGRNPDKGAVALNRICNAVPGAVAQFQLLDVASLASVNACADVLLTSERPIDLLVNNAGVMAIPTRKTTVDGFEMQFATNHLGHFLLTARLLPLLRQARPSRVVNVSSLLHRRGTMNFDDLQSEHRYSPTLAYSQSKLANLLFTFELQRRSTAGDWGVMAVAAHPGGSTTDLIANGRGNRGLITRLNDRLVGLIGQSAPAGALPILFASTASEAKNGGYYGPDGLFELRGSPKLAQIARKAKDAETAKRLWDVSAQLTGANWPN